MLANTLNNANKLDLIVKCYSTNFRLYHRNVIPAVLCCYIKHKSPSNEVMVQGLGVEKLKLIFFLFVFCISCTGQRGKAHENTCHMKHLAKV